MLELMKSLGRRLPPPLKTGIKRRLGMPMTRLHPDFSILAPIGPVEEKHVIVDAGAHHGWFFHVWRDWCPLAQVHAFEPAAEAFAFLEERWGEDPSVVLNPVGLGASRETRAFHVMTQSRVSNSFLGHVPETWESIGYETGALEIRQAPITTLNDYLEERQIERVHLLKIDVQGFELELLRGTEDVLDRIDHILVESQIRPLYTGAPGFARVWDHLAARGFHLMDMRAWHRGDGVLVEADLLLRRDALAPGIDPAVDRHYSRIGHGLRAAPSTSGG